MVWKSPLTIRATQLAKETERAKLALFPGDDHLPWVGAWEPIVDEIEEFLTGARRGGEADRALALPISRRV